jgi:predicted transposase YdaD
MGESRIYQQILEEGEEKGKEEKARQIAMKRGAN